MNRALVSAILPLIACVAFAGDACQDQMPLSLVASVKKHFPTFRAPLMTDNSADDTSWNLKQGRNGCLGVATADFDGDKVKDFILGLTSQKVGGALIVVALSRGKAWQFEVLDGWSESRSRLFVDTAPPGTYELSEALDGPGRSDTTPLKCPHSVAVYGGIEAWSVANCYKKGKWLHVQISD